jgi:hypothetical protein
MKFHQILLLIFLALVLVGCRASQASDRQSRPRLEEDAQPQQNPSQEQSPDSLESEYDLPHLPVPTVGSVVITNTTATPISPETSASGPPPTPALQKLAEQAREDLANRLNINIVKIELAKIVPAKWPYDSLGCPLPESGSVDTSTPGYQILLKADDQVYTYHTDGEGWIGLCNVKPPNEIRTLP